MSNQEPGFAYTYLESRLRERLANALTYINTLSKEEILRCDNACLTEIVRQFAVSPPILRSDLIQADEDIIESVDITFDRKTGYPNFPFFIPIERDAEWLEEVHSQTPPLDEYPLAFLDKKRSRISIRLMLSPDRKLPQSVNISKVEFSGHNRLTGGSHEEITLQRTTDY